MKYTLLLILCLPLIASAQVPAVISGDYVVTRKDTFERKTFTNSTTAKKYAEKLRETCGGCTVELRQPTLIYPGYSVQGAASSKATSLSSSSASSLPAGVSRIEGKAPPTRTNGTALLPGELKGYEVYNAKGEIILFIYADGSGNFSYEGPLNMAQNEPLFISAVDTQNVYSERTLVIKF